MARGPSLGSLRGDPPRRLVDRVEQTLQTGVVRLGDPPVRVDPRVHRVGVMHLHAKRDTFKRPGRERGGVVIDEQVGLKAIQFRLGGLWRDHPHLHARASALHGEGYGLAVHLR